MVRVERWADATEISDLSLNGFGFTVPDDI